MQKHDSFGVILKAIKQDLENYFTPEFQRFSVKRVAKLAVLLALLEAHKIPESYAHEFIEYKYDDKGNMIEEIEKNRNGTIINSREYKYDEKGNMIESIKKNGEIIEFFEYKYDDKGSVVEAIGSDPREKNGNFLNIYYKYDDKGNMIKKHSATSRSDYRSDY